MPIESNTADALTLPNSLWAATASPASPHTPLCDDITVDIAIIGAGFCGLNAALQLSQKNLKVCVIETAEIGWGASGRNGGQVNPIGHESPQQIAKRWAGMENYAERYCQLYQNSADALFSLIKKHNIQCDAEQNGWIRGTHSKKAIPQFEKMFTGWSESGAELEYIDQAAIENLTGSAAYHCGWIAKRGGSVQPLSYARGLAATAESFGASIFTQTRIQKIKPSGDRWKLYSQNHSIVADKILLCTNGYTDNLFPDLRKSLIPAISIQAATSPLTEKQIETILPKRHTFADTRRVIYYFRKTAENRLVFGTAGTLDENPGPSGKKRIISGLRNVFPQFSDLKIEYLWGGKIAITQDHLPHLHQLAPGIWTGLGFNGRGVAMASAMGRILADLILGNDKKDLPIPLTQIKKYPLHTFYRSGIRMLVPLKEFQDRIEQLHP